MHKLIVGVAVTAMVIHGAFAAVGCGTGSGSSQVSLKGAVQKGPFVLGSTITISPLDNMAQPTGKTFLTQTTNDKGEFAVNFDASGLVSLQGDGFYFNEVSGGLSTSQLTLRALYVVEQSGAQQAYLNLITHLTYLRVRHLVLASTPYADAVKQAEKELRDEMGITLAGFDPSATAIQMNLLGGDTPATQYLLAVGAVLISSSSSDAGLQELTNTIATNLEENGKLSMSNKAKLAKGALAFDTNVVEANLKARLDDLGSDATVPDMDQILDQDADKLVNANDNCPVIANPDQLDSDMDGLGDACDPCPFTGCKTGQLETCKSPQKLGDMGLCYQSCNNSDMLCSGNDECINIDGFSEKGAISLCAPKCDPFVPTCDVGSVCQMHQAQGPVVCIPDLDPDGDKLIAKDDNCPVIANPDQLDTNKNGVGDVCDECATTFCAKEEKCVLPQGASADKGVCYTDCLSSACSGDGKCNNTSDPNYCTALCDPLAPSCPNGQTCYLNYGLKNIGPIFGFSCGVPHILAPTEGQPCTIKDFYNTCVKGTLCSGFSESVCRPVCNLDSPSCKTGTCMAYAGIVGSDYIPANLGVCML